MGEGGRPFDHLRIPIDEEQMWDAAGNKEPEAFALLDAALDWCEAAELYAVVDLHILRTHYFLDESDPPLILTFHYYLPMFVTHYTAPWWAVGGTYDGPIQYPGKPIADENLARLSEELLAHIDAWNQPFDKNTMIANVQEPLAVSKRTGLPLYCGEFGCFDRAPDAIRVAWFKDILAVFDAYDIGWANWDYKGSFGIVGHDGEETAIAAVLLGKA